MEDASASGAAARAQESETSLAETTGPAIGSPGTRIDIVSDTICPWCYIGKRQLERALAMLSGEGLEFSVRWHPFQLNPDMPAEGRDRMAYRIAKFGSAEKAAELDRRITDAAADVGLAFRTDLMTRTPNTVLAHRLIWLAGQQGVQDPVVEALFAAYFTQGQDIGAPDVLIACAVQAGLDGEEVARVLASDAGEQEVRAADRAARSAGVNGVPSFFLGGYVLFSGAMPAATIASALRRGRQLLQERAA